MRDDRKEPGQALGILGPEGAAYTQTGARSGTVCRERDPDGCPMPMLTYVVRCASGLPDLVPRGLDATTPIKMENSQTRTRVSPRRRS